MAPNKQVALEPHRGYLHLDLAPQSQEWLLSHSLTKEVVALGRHSEAVLVYDDEGFAEVFRSTDGGEDVGVGVDSLLKYGLYKGQEGDYFVQATDETGAVTVKGLTTMRAISKQTVASIRMESSSFDIGWPVAVFELRRGGGYVTWCFKTFYESMGLKQYQGQSWTWIKKLQQHWADGLAEWQCREAILLSRDRLLQDGDRCLQWTSISSVGLMLVLARWAFLCPRRGGFRREEDKGAAKKLLCSFVHIICESCHDLVVHVFLDERVTMQLPRPIYGNVPCRLHITRDGMLAMNTIRDNMNDHIDTMPEDFSIFANTELEPEHVSVIDFVQGALKRKGSEILAAQLLTELGLILDDIVKDRSIDGEKYLATNRLSVALMDSEEAVLKNATHMQAYVAAYVKASKENTGEETCFSVATDKGRVHGFNLMLTALAKPDNSASWLPPQVAPDFEGPLSLTDGIDGEDAVLEELDKQEARQEAWLKRKENASAASWRPRKRCRTSAFHWLAMLNHQLNIGSGMDIQRFILNSEDMEKNGHPLMWPHLTIAPDRGPDGVAAVQYLQNKCFANVDLTPDRSHDSWNSVKEACREAGMWSVVLLTLLSMNLPHGPYGEDVRFRQAQEALQEIRRFSAASRSPLFREMVNDMRWEMSFDTNAAKEQTDEDLLRSLPELSCFVHKSYRTNLNRFMGWVKESKREAPFWSARRFVYTYIAIEADMLKNPKLANLVMKGGGAQDGSTAAKKHLGEEKLLRASCQNTLVMSIMVLGDMMNRFRVRAIVGISGPLVANFEQQSHELRDVEASLDWQRRQVRGESAEVGKETFDELGKPSSLEWMGFRLPVESNTKFDDTILVEEDSKAELLGQLARALMFGFYRRTIWLWGGWPSKIVGALDEEPRRSQVLEEFREDVEAYESLTERCDFPEVGKVLERSTFNKATVWQLVEVLRGTRWKAEESFLDLVTKRHKRLMTSQIIEDGLNRAKNARRAAAGPKYSPPERAMAVVAVRNVLGSVHGYNETVGSKHLAPATTRLPHETWQAKTKDAHQVLKDIVGTKSPDWYSPGAAGLATEFSDLALIKEAVSRKLEHCIRHSWMCILFSWKHDIAVRKKVGAERGWMLPLGPVRESAALAIRLEVSQVPGHSQVTTFKVMDGAPVVLPLLRHEEWEACEIRWLSPLRMQRDLPTAPWACWATVAMVMSGPATPLLQMAARRGFWMVPRSYILRFCDLVGAEAESGASMFALCFSLISHLCPKMSEDDIMSALKHRKVMMSRNVGCCTEDLLEMDEACEALDKEEQRELRSEKGSAKERLDDLAKFKASWKEKKVAIRTKVASGGKTKKKAKTSGTGGPPRIAIPTDVPMTQESAKKYLPPNAALWKARGSSSWNARYAMYPQISRSWRRHGEQGALLQCLRHCWDQYLEDEGLERADCNVTNLFDVTSTDDIVVEASSSKAASSSAV